MPDTFADPAMPRDVRHRPRACEHTSTADPLAGSAKADASRPVPPPKRGPLGKLVKNSLAPRERVGVRAINLGFRLKALARRVAMVEDERQGLEVEFAEGMFTRRHTSVNPCQFSSVNACNGSCYHGA